MVQLGPRAPLQGCVLPVPDDNLRLLPEAGMQISAKSNKHLPAASSFRALASLDFMCS